MGEEIKNKNLFYMIILIMTLIVMLIGATLAYFRLVASQEEDKTIIKTGTLAIDYIDGEIVSPLLLPIKEPSILDPKLAYSNSFTIKSSGTLDQTIGIYLDLTTNEFTDNIIKYALYNSNNEKVSTGSLPKTGNINLINNVYLASNNMLNYTLLLWLYDNDTDQDFEQGNKLVGTVRVEAIQVKYE